MLRPYFVADRPISLKILKSSFQRKEGVGLPFGVMTHAFTSSQFHELVKSFPHDDATSNCVTVRGGSTLCADCEDLRRRIDIIADSGVFSKQGCSISYADLFKRYEAMGVKTGVMIDFLGDCRATIESARDGKNVLKQIYRSRPSLFELMAVAQGKTLDEYLNCYAALTKMGFAKIAIGGLLRKRENTARYVYLSSVDFVEKVVTAIKKEFSPSFLFLLGCYHPNRHDVFEKLGVSGSDYKGWIFQYRHRQAQLKDASERLLRWESKGRVFNKLRIIRKKEAAILKKYFAGRTPQSERYVNGRAVHSPAGSGQLISVQRELSARRLKIAANRSVPEAYKREVNHYARVWKKSDQTVRFAEVHRYLSREVYSKMQACMKPTPRGGE